MSFFFSQKKKELSRPVAHKLSQANKSSKDTLNRLGCKVCPLNKTSNLSPKMEPDLIDEPDIYILGDQPTESDDEKNKHFTGRSGKLLRSILGNTNSVAFDYCIRDYSSDGKGVGGWVALECCRSLVAASIEKARPKVIAGLGLLPLQWMLNSSDMVGLRGRLFAVKIGNHSCYFIPTYDPDFVVEKAFDKKEPLRSSLGHCLKFDLEKAIRVAQTLPPPQIDTPQAVRAGIQTFNGHEAGQLEALLKLMGEATRAPTKAIDLETSTLRPYATKALLLTMAVSFGDTNFSFAINHPKAGWKPHEQKQIIAAIKVLLSTESRIIAHNTPFEVEWLISLVGKDAIFHDLWECTMMQSHFLDERRGKRGGNDEQFQPNPYQALDFLVKQYFGISYKPLFKLDRKNMAAADLDETLLYNGADTKYTLRLYAFQVRLLKQAGLYNAYLEARLRQPTVALMQSIGIDVDQSKNEEFNKQLTEEIKEIDEKIFDLPEVKGFLAERKTFNPDSHPDLIYIFKNYIKVGKALINAEGKESTDKGTLGKIAHPLAGLVEQRRNRSKLRSTYVTPFQYGVGEFIWPDKRIHPAFNTTFAETGRTSSDEPNQQNWPSRNDKWVRRQIVAKKGYVLVAFDYGQLEACTAAMCTRDGVLVDALWNDYDIHMEWATRAVELFPDFIEVEAIKTAKNPMKDFRGIIKNKMVFASLFGAKMESVNDYLVTTLGVEVPMKVTGKLMDEFWDKFNQTLSWQKRIMSDYYELGYIQTPTGRRRHYPLTKNQGVNFPIQSLGCDIVCNAMVRLSQMAADTGKWYLHPIMNIHDDLTFCIPEDDKTLDEAIEIIIREMLKKSYDFINVPLSVSCSIGKNWLDMDELEGKFWSHKL